MAKRAMPDEFGQWIDGLEMPDEQKRYIRKSMENSVVVDKFHHMNAGFTQATQENSQLKEWAKQIQPALGWMNDNKDVLSDERWGEVASEVRARRLGQPSNGTGAPQRSLHEGSAEMAALQQELDAIATQLSQGEMSWEDAQRTVPKLSHALRRIASDVPRYDQLAQQVEELRQTLPQLIAAQRAEQEQRLQAVQNEQRQLGREYIDLSQDMQEYGHQHPERMPRIVSEFKTGQHRTLRDAADALYADEDREAALQRQVDERYQQHLQQQNGEGAMGSYPMRPLERGASAPHPQASPSGTGQRVFHVRNRESLMRQNMQRVLRDPDAPLLTPSPS